MEYTSVVPLPSSYYANRRMMFNWRDRELLSRLEAKIDVALNRVATVESKQASHEAICDVRQENLEAYMKRKDEEEKTQRQEWHEFMDESRDSRNRIERSMWTSNTALLWKVIGVLVGAIGLVITLTHYGVIK